MSPTASRSTHASWAALFITGTMLGAIMIGLLALPGTPAHFASLWFATQTGGILVAATGAVHLITGRHTWPEKHDPKWVTRATVEGGNAGALAGAATVLLGFFIG